MATIYVGSARIGENGKSTGGKVGDQKQTSTPDYKGEVSMQTLASFVSGRKLYILRPKQAIHAQKLAQAMKTACNNPNLGYDQNGRLGVITYGVDATTKTECDCSSLVRACIKKATGTDVGNFTTANEVAMLVQSGLFDKAIVYGSATKVYEGDVFVTQTKGHTGICTDGYSRTTADKPSVASPVIKNGSTGTHAILLQQDLNYVINAGLAVDGKFGPKSVAALKKWQAVSGLTADGIYGPKSYAVMSKTLA